MLKASAAHSTEERIIRMCLFCLLYLFLSASPLLIADTVTLNSGEVVIGRILSETDSQVEIETTNAKRTIFSKTQIPKANIRAIARETAEQTREKTEYGALTAQYKLYPSKELTKEQYIAGIAAFQVYLQGHPGSIFATELSSSITAWQAESANVESGLVKFADKWMLPDEKVAESRGKKISRLNQYTATSWRSKTNSPTFNTDESNSLNTLPPYVGVWLLNKANSTSSKINGSLFTENILCHQERMMTTDVVSSEG